MNKMLEYWVPDKKIRKEIEKEVIKRLGIKFTIPLTLSSEK